MNSASRPLLKSSIFAFIVLTSCAFLANQGSPAWIRGVSSNFDLHNFTEKPVNDFELTLEPAPMVPAGRITIGDIVKLYAGHAGRGWRPEVRETELGIVITWKAPDGTYLEPCEWLHLGISLRAGAPPIRYAKATWTLDGRPVGTVAFVWQNWVGYADSSVGDIIIPPTEFPTVPGGQEPDTLIVLRRWAASKSVIPLDNMTQDDPLILSLDWSPKSQQDILTPDSGPSEMLIPPTAEEVQSVVVQYPVALESTGNVEAVFTNQAQLVHDPRPRPRLLKPVDNLGLRPDMVYGVVNLWATEDTGLWDDEIVLTGFDFSSDGGKSWEPIGQDDDGTVPSEATLPNTYVHNWWHVQWDVSQSREGPYLVKATMADRFQNIGEDIIELYIDPTPPIPLLKLRDHQVFVDPTDISCTTFDEDVVSVIWEVQLKRLYYTKGIPLLDQHNYGVGQVNNGNMYCAPTASAACLKWWASHGYPSLTRCLDGFALTDTQLVEGLADEMDTSSVGGTAPADIASGLREWISDRGLGLTVTGPSAVTPTAVRNEVENCKEDVLIGIYWNTGGGHRVTVNSIANFTNADGSTTVDIMDPWDGAIVNITMKPNGDVTWPGKAGVQESDNMITVSPTKPRIPWIFIAQGLSVKWDPGELQPGLYFLRATITDERGNQGSSQIVARVGQQLLPVIPIKIALGRDNAILLQWEETEFDLKYAYTVEFTDDLLVGIWQPLPGTWPISETSWSGDDTAGLGHRYYRIVKDHEPK